jgi:hypothetical protein
MNLGQLMRTNSTHLCLRALLLSAAALSTSAFGADFDGSKALICAPSEVLDCTSGDDKCWSGPPRKAGAPSFLRIDFARKTVSGPHLTSKILHVNKSDGQILLQGVELDMGWTVAIDSDSGNVSITLTDRDGAFVMFGACMAP